MTLSKDTVVGVVGLGYVGLPVAVAFGQRFPTIGYDLSSEKVEAYRSFRDPTGEVGESELRAAERLECTTDPARLSRANMIIVAVPTPLAAGNLPDFAPLRSASETVGRHMKAGTTVVFESTVYPGATREVCAPLLEQHSGLKWKRDFFVGYSPERIDPGNRERRFDKILKVVSGDTPETLEKIASLYGSVVQAGVHRASSMEIAEAAKVIENTQRDLNIAFVNELSILFHKLGLDTVEVLEVAGTKWNFLGFRPGLVGGHCIGVDPYYLTHRAEQVGYYPQVILAGRRINDGMGRYVAQETVKLLVRAGRQVNGATVNVLGLTFKEDVPDLRNSRVIDIIDELKSYGVTVNVHDPEASAEEAQKEYGIKLTPWKDLPRADALVLAVSHKALLKRPMDELLSKIAKGGCFVDVKSRMSKAALEERGLLVWRL
jgi:UDP-N-acetyl-D-galactosamine dehydrogenase